MRHLGEVATERAFLSSYRHLGVLWLLPLAPFLFSRLLISLRSVESGCDLNRMVPSQHQSSWDFRWRSSAFLPYLTSQIDWHRRLQREFDPLNKWLLYFCHRQSGVSRCCWLKDSVQRVMMGWAELPFFLGIATIEICARSWLFDDFFIIYEPLSATPNIWMRRCLPYSFGLF